MGIENGGNLVHLAGVCKAPEMRTAFPALRGGARVLQSAPCFANPDPGPCMKKLLSANQAIAWAAYRAGCRVAAAYPGTPSTEIMEHIAEFAGAINCEWSVNEKVAMECIGVAGRHPRAGGHEARGLNVAMDRLMTFTISAPSVAW